MSADNIIEIEHLSKSFGQIKAVDDLSFRVKRGELFAFLGVNGAGKSTTISMICGLLKKDAGSIRVCGSEVEKTGGDTSKKLGIVFQNSVLDAPLIVLQNLRCRAALYGITGKAFSERIDGLCGLLGLSDILNRPVGKLSGGQRRRADVARALLHRPEMLILDEPTTGLDPKTRKILWDAVGSLRAEDNTTVFLTTHYMEEAADADFAVILDSGKIAAAGTPLELKNTYAGDYITLYGVTKEQLSPLGLDCAEIKDGVRLFVKNTAEAAELIKKHPSLFSDFEVTKGKMDDIFLAVTGKKLEGGM